MTVVPELETQNALTSPNQALQSYSLDHVRERLVRKNILSEEIVDEAIAEYRRYMTLVSLGYAPLNMFSQQVDEVWHMHILFTQDYANFCEQTLGHFLHHNPKTVQEGVEERKEGAARFIEAYTTVFGSQPPSIWSGLNNLNTSCRCCAYCG